MAKGKTFVYQGPPSFQFNYLEFKNWEAVRYSDSTLRYNPSAKLGLMFEVPPSIVVLNRSKVPSQDVVLRHEQGTNSFGVKHTQVFVKNFAREGYLFEKGSHSTLVLTLEGHEEHGLMAELAAKALVETFEFK